jgi:hypothetical protein
MSNYLRDTTVLDKNDLEIIYYYLHHFYLRLIVFLDI